jgi:predicted RecB family nuclease
MRGSSNQRFRLTASAIASHFKHRCDRRFRWATVGASDRGRAGIGWNVPRRVRSHSRPGIILLMTAGDEFEIGRVAHLESWVSTEPPIPGVAPRVIHGGVQSERGRERIAALPLDEVLNLLSEPTPPRFIAQVEINLTTHPQIEISFLQQFGLNPTQMTLGIARPDLIEVIPPDSDHTQFRLRIWDFKGSQVPRHEHFIQVAFYSMLLESVLVNADLPHLAVDTDRGVIEARREMKEFELAPYRRALTDFLRHRVPELLTTPAADAHFLVHEGCVLCEYMDECRAQANAGFDLSRIPYITSESKRHLLAAGYRSHTDLAQIDLTHDQTIIEHLRSLSHTLSANVARYIATAQALQDGEPRILERSTFQMPEYEDIRVVLCAEQDAVTGTCFALGLKTYEGWDQTQNRPLGQEQVFLTRHDGDEATLLLAFLRVLNRFLERIHTTNEAVHAQPIETDSRMVNATRALQDAEAALAAFKTEHAAMLRRRNDEARQLRTERGRLEQEVREAQTQLRQTQQGIERERRRAQKRLHFYIYDTLDMLALRGLLERHIFDTESPALLAELGNLVRLFPPESVLPNAEAFRSIPATVVVQMLRSLVALPIPYSYDLRNVSELYQPASGGYRFRTPYGFSWEHSNQIAFERIHNVWDGESFTYRQGGTERVLDPAEILNEIDRAVRSKLRATDSVVRKLKEDLRNQLLLRKEPFRLYTESDPIQIQMLEALRIFTTLEVSYDELETKQTHTKPVDERVAGFVCIHGLQAEATELDSNHSLWFQFDPAASDTKFEVGDFNLVLTPEDEPTILLNEIDSDLFNTDRGRWRFEPYKVTLVEYDLQSMPPRVRLAPSNSARFLQWFDPTRFYVLDRLFVDYNSQKVFRVLARLGEPGAQASHIHSLLSMATIEPWEAFVEDIDGLEANLRDLISTSDANPDHVLNTGQWHAWRGVMSEPLTLVWGPPGTGKTHTLAHMLIGYALVARQLRQPLRILVSAFTHHAINNVLKKVAELVERYGIAEEDLQITKLQGYEPHPSDADLQRGVAFHNSDQLADLLTSTESCLIVGATVWSIYRAMNAADDVVQQWFDVILIDEASQLKLPDAIIALAASKPSANIILAGDDRQLPPIIHGDYPEEHQHMLSSIFAFVRERIEHRQETNPGIADQSLFQLEENFRMNEPLTAYPRQVLYNQRFFSNQPDIRISTTRPVICETDDLIELLMHPDLPVILVRYDPPRSFTARNPIEADIAAELVTRLQTILINQRTGNAYSPVEMSQSGIAILSPHRAQNSTIRQVLTTRGFGREHQPMPLVDTVDKLQGQERDIIIVSYGVADMEYAEGEAEFLLSSNRFNVAATRARHKLVVLCANTVLEVVPTDQQVLLDAMMLKEFRRYCDSGHRRFEWTTRPGDIVSLDVQWKAFEV